MGMHVREKKQPWNRERWLWVLLTLIYIALVGFYLFSGVHSPELPAQRSEEYARTNEMILSLPTSEPFHHSPAPTQAPSGVRRKLDINQADAWMLTAIPGVGEAIADKIIVYRDSQGGMAFVEELMRVDGVGERLFDTLIQYIEVRQ